MPRPAQVTSNALTLQMQSRGIASARELAQALRVDRSSISRGLSTLGSAVLRIGAARSARYALRRPVRNLGNRWPLHRIDHRGRAHETGVLHCMHGGFLCEMRDAMPAWFRHGYAGGIFPGPPFFLSDARPQGFMGRAIAREWGPRNGLPADLQQWQDDDVLVSLLLLGRDLPGDLVLGDRMLEECLESVREGGPPATPLRERGARYAALASEAMRGGPGGSSAGGEQPKFTATVRDSDGEPRPVLVKFSPPMDTPAGRRWGDLLTAEWHALRLLAGHGHTAADAELLEGGGRRFLEVTRFDRIGAHGRRGVLTLQAVEAGLLDEPAGDWPAVARAMQTEGMLTEADAAALRRRWCFGRLIGNSDMHLANAGVWWTDAEPFALAPAYDMLPMVFSPGAQGEIVPREFVPAPPFPGVHREWTEVSPWALEFWRRVGSDERISAGFRRLAGDAEDATNEAVKQFG